MKQALILFFLLGAATGYGQAPVKISRRIALSIKIWPDTAIQIGRWFAGQSNAIQVSFPSLENDRRIEILKYSVREKNGKARITEDQKIKNVFWICPDAAPPGEKQPKLELEFWVRISNPNVLVPVSKDTRAVFDKDGQVILQHAKWIPLSQLCSFENNECLLETRSFGVNTRRPVTRTE